MLPSPRPERRRDRRHSVAGHAFLRGLKGQGELFGGIVDVSAGGVRLRVRRGHGVGPGDVLALDLEVCVPDAPPSSPPLRLRGRGSVVRCSEGRLAPSEVAVRFCAPLEVCDAFAAPGAVPVGSLAP